MCHDDDVSVHVYFLSQPRKDTHKNTVIFQDDNGATEREGEPLQHLRKEIPEDIKKHDVDTVITMAH